MFELINQLRILLTRRDKIALVLMVIFSFIAAVWELLGIGLAVPVVAAVVNPDLLEQNYYLKLFYQLMPCSEPRSFMLFTALLVVVNFALKSIFNLVLLKVESCFVYRKQHELSVRLFERFAVADYQVISRIPAAEISARISRVGNVCEGTLLPLMQAISDFMVIMVIALGVMFFMPIYLSLAVVLMILAALLLYWPFRKYNMRLGSIFVSCDNAASRDKIETFSGIKTIKSSNSTPFFIRRFSKDIAGYSQVRAKLYFWGQLPRFTLEFMTVFMAMMVFCGMILADVPSGSVVLRFALLAAATGRILPALSRLHYNMTLLKQISQVLNGMFEDITALPPESEAEPAGTMPEVHLNRALEIKDLSFTYKDGKKVFDNFSLTIPAAASVALIGPTGGGKTTLVDLIIGLQKPDNGGIYFDGCNIAGNLTQIRKITSYVPQFVFLFDGSIKDNVALGCAPGNIDEKRVLQALALANLADWVESLPHGINSPVGEGGVNLSGGQRQRLGIARALYGDADLLIFDEPTSALDEQSENCIVETLKTLHGKKTVLIIAHRMSTVEHCDMKIHIGK